MAVADYNDNHANGSWVTGTQFTADDGNDLSLLIDQKLEADGDIAMSGDLDMGGNLLANLLGGGGIAGLKFGTFAGDGSSDRNITMGFIPDLYWQWGDGATSGTMSCCVFMNGCLYYIYFGAGTHGSVAVATGYIQADGSDGVVLNQTGASGGPNLNISGDGYTFIGLKFS
jgi:hypothetical protein